MPIPLDFTPTLSDVIAAAIEAHSADLHVAMPAKVVTYYKETQTVDVLPVFTKTFFDTEGNKFTEALPLIQNVPVVFPRGGNAIITWPLFADDFVLLVCADRNMGQWQETGESGDQGDTRTHELSGAFAIAGGYPTPQASDQAHETHLVISSPSIRLGDIGAGEAMVLGDSLRSWLASHTHGTGTGPTTSPIQGATLGSTLSTRHKVDS